MTTLIEYDTDAAGNPLPPGFKQRRAAPQPAKLTEEERAKHYAAARAAIAAGEQAMARCAELRPLVEAIEAERADASRKLAKAVEPLREQLADVNKQIDAQRPTGKPLDVLLLERRDEVHAKIAKFENTAYFAEIERKERLAPLHDELASLRAAIGRMGQARQDVLRYAPPAIAARLYTAGSALRWAEARLSKARELNGSAPSPLTAAELQYALEALAAAREQTNAANSAALNG
jgi:hypothetical protein